MGRLSEQRKERADNSTAPPVFLFVLGLQKFKKLRHEDDFDFSFGGGDEDLMTQPKAVDPGAEFNDIVMEGSALGIHLFVCVDTFNNVNRFFGRKALSEFEMRILFQMSANDSAALADTPKASTLGMHRALLYNDQQGTLETFRPYAVPDKGWLEEGGGGVAGVVFWFGASAPQPSLPIGRSRAYAFAPASSKGRSTSSPIIIMSGSV